MVDEALAEIGGFLVWAIACGALWSLGVLARVAWGSIPRKRIRSTTRRSTPKKGSGI